MFIMECYFRSNPSRLGYRKRMLELWNSKGLFFITELGEIKTKIEQQERD